MGYGKDTAGRPGRLTVRLSLYLGTVLLAVLAGAWGLSGVWEAELATNNSTRVLATLDQIARGVEVELRRVRLLAAALVEDESLRLLEQVKVSEDPAEILELHRDINTRVNGVFSIMSHELSLLVYFFNDGTFEPYRNGIDQKTADSILESIRLHARSLDAGGSVILDNLEPYSTGSGTSLYQLAVAIRPDPALFPTVRLVYLAMSPGFFNQILERLKTADGTGDASFYAIVSNNGRIMFPTAELRRGIDLAALNQAVQVEPGLGGMRVIEGDAGTYLATALTLERVPWKIVYFTDRQGLTAGARRAGGLAVLVMIPIVLAFALFFHSLRHAFLRPLDLLMGRMRQYARGQKPGQGQDSVPDEFRKVFRQFDAMVQEIDVLTTEKIEAERAALQFQINPHFLSNTLSAMRFMAMMSKAEGMKSMIEALMDMMSYQLTSPSNMSTLERETENLRRYEYIMKVRYGDTFDLVFELDPALLDQPMLTMLLQPLVENSIEHGIRSIDRRGSIVVRAFTDPGRPGQYSLEVEDNGCGIPADKLAVLLLADSRADEDAPEQKSQLRRGRIGVYNVHRRIVNSHGPGFGLRIESVEGQHTRIGFSLPLGKKEVDHGRSLAGG